MTKSVVDVDVLTQPHVWLLINWIQILVSADVEPILPATIYNFLILLPVSVSALMSNAQVQGKSTKIDVNANVRSEIVLFHNS